MSNFTLEKAIDDLIAVLQIELPLQITAINSTITDNNELRAISTSNFIFNRNSRKATGMNEFFFYEPLQQVNNAVGDGYSYSFPYQLIIGIGYLDNSATASTEIDKFKYSLRYRQALLQTFKNCYAKLRARSSIEVSQLANLTNETATNERINTIEMLLTINIGE